MTVVYNESDADIRVLKDKTIGVIGYGNMGRPLALNLQDSGVRVVTTARTAETEAEAVADGIPFLSMEQVVRSAEILLLLLPDEEMAAIYLNQISPHLTRAHTLMFASGYNIAFNYIEPPSFVDVGLLAPRTFGEAARERYLNGQGFYSFVASHQDSSGKLWPTILALAKAVGSLRAGAVEVTIQQEVELDLFMQQAILPAVHHILTSAAKLLLSRGYPPEAAMMDLYVSGELNDYLDRRRIRGCCTRCVCRRSRGSLASLAAWNASAR
ncbi:NAD(P)-binding domain-containing protein [bacterium]|nr:NAD(P)-binding domain-containing protein [bacterium]